MSTISSERVNTNTQWTDETSPVAIPSTGYVAMADSWELILDLLGGTQTMRDAGTKWLPQEANEEDDAYTARLGRSILYNGFKDTLQKLANRPFTVPVKIAGLPSNLEYLEDDVDGQNTPLSEFIKSILRDLIEFGVAHIYVDHSKISPVEGREITIAEEEAAGARVYFRRISPVDLIGWQTERNEKSNTTELTQIRVQEVAVEASGDYGDAEVNYINVYNKDTWERHRQDDDETEKYEMVDYGVSTLGRIPLITIYADQTGFMTAAPPLMDLAWLNLAHWQSYSDQRNILKYSRFGLLFGKGFEKKQVDAGRITVGPQRAVLTTSTEAELSYVEPTGKGIEAGSDDLQDIEEKMRVLGNQPMVKQIPTTATEQRNDESRTVSQLQAWVGSTERGIKQAIKLAGEWRKTEIPEDMNVDIYSDFEATVLGGSDKELLLKARAAGEITGERFLREEQRRGVFSQDMDPEEEARAAAEEDSRRMSDIVPNELLLDEDQDEDQDQDQDQDELEQDQFDEDELGQEG